MTIHSVLKIQGHEPREKHQVHIMIKNLYPHNGFTSPKAMNPATLVRCEPNLWDWWKHCGGIWTWCHFSLAPNQVKNSPLGWLEHPRKECIAVLVCGAGDSILVEIRQSLMSTSLFAIQVGHIGNRILCLPALNLGNKCGKKWFVRPDQGHHAKNVGKSTIQRVSFFLLTKPPWTQNHETNRLRIWLEFKNFVFAIARKKDQFHRQARHGEWNRWIQRWQGLEMEKKNNKLHTYLGAASNFEVIENQASFYMWTIFC